MPAEPVRRAAAGALVVLACSAAAAAAAWSPAERASVGPLVARSPDVAMNRRGDAAAAWVRGAGRKAMVVVSLRAAGGDWSRPEGDLPARAARGRPAGVAGRRRPGGGRVAPGGRHPPGALRGPAAPQARPRGARARAPGGRDALGPHPDAVEPPADGGPARPGHRRAAASPWPPGTGAPGTPRTIPAITVRCRCPRAAAPGRGACPTASPGSDSCDQLRAPRVGVGGAGQAVVWWQCDLPGDRTTAFSSSRAPDQPFTVDRELPFQSAGDARGRPRGVRERHGRGRERRRRWPFTSGAARCCADGVSLEELPVAGSRPSLDRDGGPPQLAVNASGDALSAWIGSDLRTRAAVIAVRPRGGRAGGARSRQADPPRRCGWPWATAAWAWWRGRAPAGCSPTSRAADGSLAIGTRISRRRRLRRRGARGGDGRRRRRGRVLDAATSAATRWWSARSSPPPEDPGDGRWVRLGASRADGCGLPSPTGEDHASRITVTRVSFRDVRASHATGRTRVHSQAARHRSRPVQVRLARSRPTTCSSPSAA